MNYGHFSYLFQPLSLTDVKNIHQASMQILEQSGFRVNNSKALTLLKDHGADVDFEKNIIRVKEDWVMKYIKEAPPRIILYGREERHNLVVEAGRVFFGTGGTALNVYDLKSGKRRLTSSKDIADIARLTDALPNLHWHCLPVYPNELKKEEADIARFFLGIKNTTKHVMGGIYGSHDGAMEVIRLAQLIAGGKESLRQKPIISVICSTISPFVFESRYVDFIFDLADAGIPIATSCAPIAGATAPVTLAGTLAQINAEAICGVLLTQVIKKGTPVFYSTVPTTANMKTMEFLFGSIENGMMNAACAQMAAYYNLPMYSTGGVTDSKLIDFQNGSEKIANNLLPALAGAQLIHNAAGLIDSSMAVAYEQYILDNDIIGMALRVIDGINLNQESLAVEQICSAGPGGNHIASEHTVKYMRSEQYVPRTAVRSNYSSWQKGGSLGALEQAKIIAEKILSDHVVTPLPEELVLTELEKKYPALYI